MLNIVIRIRKSPLRGRARERNNQIRFLIREEEEEEEEVRRAL